MECTVAVTRAWKSAGVRMCWSVVSFVSLSPNFLTCFGRKVEILAPRRTVLRSLYPSHQGQPCNSDRGHRPVLYFWLFLFFKFISFFLFGNWTLDVWGSSEIVTDFRLVQFHKFGQITFTIWHCKYSQSCAFWKSESSQVKQLFCCQKTTWILGIFFCNMLKNWWIKVWIKRAKVMRCRPSIQAHATPDIWICYKCQLPASI